MKTMKNNKLLMAGIIFMVILAVVAFFGQYMAPYEFDDQDLARRLESPSSDYPLGTDQLGRCLLSRLLYGGEITIGTAFGAAFFSAFIGIILGLMAGYFSGAADEIIMRFTDIILSFPAIVLTLAMVGIMGPNLINIVIAMTLVGWTHYARVVRGSVLSIKEEPYVKSARAMGGGDFYIIFKHILPNTLSSIIVMFTLGMGTRIITISGLSFLGLGAQPPTPEWGRILDQGVSYMERAPHLTLFSGLAIMLAVLSFNILGDGLRDYFSPYSENLQQIKERF